MADMESIPSEHLKSNEYSIIGGIGKGNSSKVYIAREKTGQTACRRNLVALKVLYPDEDEFVTLEERIARGELPHLIRHSCEQVLLPTKLVVFATPGGASETPQQTLVMPTIGGPSIFEYARGRDCGRVPLPMAVLAIEDAISALKFLHKHDIGHGDFHNRNLLLLPSSPISQWSDEQLQTYMSSRPLHVHAAELGPKHMSSTMSFFAENDISFNGRIFLVDFGSAYQGQGPEWLIDDARFVTNAPERLEGHAWGLPSDIWSLGTTIIEILTGTEIFRPEINRYPGPCDFGRDEVRERIYELLPPWRWEPNELKSEMRSLWPPELSIASCTQLKNMLEKMLLLEPAQRLSITEVAEIWRSIREGLKL
ncbi:hypothetical protein LTR64_005256 [Lithohypha guttulata]|uniref:uncharacterized protein n=1 Tax=Lithohypha guttulata TaxID=1690604 RepID=UPI00315C6CFF